MLGAIIGDMVGSIYEFNSPKTKDFYFFNPNMKMTDDSLLTIAVAKTLLAHYPISYTPESLKAIQDDLAKEFVATFQRRPFAGFGGMFADWCIRCAEKGTREPPYGSFGNGSAMRISPVGWMAHSEEEVKLLSKTVSEITHNHPEGIKGAKAIAMAIYLALHGSTKEQIQERMVRDYYPEIQSLDFNHLVQTYGFHASCQESVPQAIYCFLISNSLQDAIANCIAIGGDTDTIAAMAGSIAEAYYQKDRLGTFELMFLYLMIDSKTRRFLRKFHERIGSKKFEEIQR